MEGRSSCGCGDGSGCGRGMEIEGRDFVVVESSGRREGFLVVEEWKRWKKGTQLKHLHNLWPKVKESLISFIKKYK